MKRIDFEWDEKKNKSNIQKHKISFTEAKTAFYDPNSLMIHDPDHSDEEERFILLGMSHNLNLLIVCHCYRENEKIIRIIPA